jgi:hypothetical protein
MQQGVERIRAARLAHPADVQGELLLPRERLDDAGGGDLQPFGICQRDFDVRTRLEGRHFEVDAHAPAIGIRLGG